MAYWHGYYSFQRIPDGIRYAIDYKKVGKEDLCELFSKVIVKHIPGRWVPRYCYIEDDVLYCIGAFEMWWVCTFPISHLTKLGNGRFI